MISPGLQCLFQCGAPLRAGLDWECRMCNAGYHYVCAGINQYEEGRVYSCLNCGNLFTDTTVAYWATRTYENVPLEERVKWATLDLNYVHNGRIVAFLPFKPGRLEDGRIIEWKERNELWMCANSKSDEQKWTMENWHRIQVKLWAVDVNKNFTPQTWTITDK